jgi:hypothetical protein
MRTAKIYKRWQIWVIFLLVITTVNGCWYEEDTKPIVTGGNPPEITFRGSGHVVQIVIAGPYSRDYLKRSLKIINDHKNIVTSEEKKELEELNRKYKDENFSIWYLKPNKDSIRVSSITLKYGTVPKELRQVNPKDGSPPQPLKEGSYYCVTAPTLGANFHDTYFIIKNNKAIMVSEKELMGEDQ